jgi:hypothetical protein
VWVPKPVWMQKMEEKSSASVGDWTLANQSVFRHHTDWATWLTSVYCTKLNITPY